MTMWNKGIKSFARIGHKLIFCLLCKTMPSKSWFTQQFGRRSTVFAIVTIFVICALDLTTHNLRSNRFLTHLNNTVSGRRYPLPKPRIFPSTLVDSSNLTTKETVPTPRSENATTTKEQTKYLETTAITFMPGILNMDRDLSLPPEVPRRPDSKEPILEYSQKREYPAILHNDDKCGSGNTVDLSLQNFDFANDVFLLMIIKSACSYTDRRDAIRATWTNEEWSKTELKVNVRHIFLLGACQTDKLKQDVIAENNKHHDILQWDFFDSFRNLTLKDCLFLRWFSKNCRNVPYVFKGDDDVFVNTRNVVDYLKGLPREKRDNLFVGSVLRGSPRILQAASKYYVSYNLFPEKYYPPYVSGGGFLMSGELIVRLFQASLSTRIIPIDDAFLGILLQKIGVVPQNDRGFKSWGIKAGSNICRLAKIKTFHKMSPQQITANWENFTKLDLSTCDKASDDVFLTQTKK